MHRPSSPRLFLLFARTAARRFVNRFLYGWSKRAEAKRRRKGLPEPDRTATAHRNQRFRPGRLLAVLFSFYILFVVGMAMEVSFRRAMNGVRQAFEPAADVISTPPQAAEDGTDRPLMTPATRTLYARGPLTELPAATLRQAERVTALLMGIAAAGTLLFGIGVLSRQLTRPEPSLSWLFEFPVPRGVLFWSKLGECLFDSAALPLLSLLPGIWFYHSGTPFWQSAGLGLAFGFLMALGVAALRICAEVLMLQKLPRRRRGSIAGLCAAFGGLLMVVVLYGGGTPLLIYALLAVSHRLPDWAFCNPLTAGFGSGTGVAAQWLTAAAVTVVVCQGAVMLCARLTRHGLEPGLETARTSTPAPPAPPATRRSLAGGLAGKELLLLTRQRTVLIQVLLAPLIMVLMLYFQSDGRIAERTLSSAGAATAAIYGISAYMVLIASQVAMNAELRTLWLLLSLPRPLAHSLRAKSAIWGLTAAALATVLSIAAAVLKPEAAAGILGRLPFVIALTALLADLSIGIRTMGSSIVSETTVHYRQWAQWLPLLLSAGAGQAVFGGDPWTLCVQLVLLGALDVSVWQKLHAELPYLTEPAEDPPPRLYLMHGQLAAYGYFVLQGLFVLLLSATGSLALPAGSAIAAGTIALITFLVLTGRRVPVFPDKKAPWRQALPQALAAATAGIAAGWLWLLLLPHLPGLNEALHTSRTALPGAGDLPGWISLGILVCIVAPLAEEFIFRGLVYRGLRQSKGPAAAILWSSLFFTAVHPPLSSVPVFLLAAANALLMERTGRLSLCVLVHALYNAAVLWLQAR